MTELNTLARAEEFVRGALLEDLKQHVDEKTIHAVARKVVKALEVTKNEAKPARRKNQDK